MTHYCWRRNAIRNRNFSARSSSSLVRDDCDFDEHWKWLLGRIGGLSAGHLCNTGNGAGQPYLLKIAQRPTHLFCDRALFPDSVRYAFLNHNSTDDRLTVITGILSRQPNGY